MWIVVIFLSTFAFWGWLKYFRAPKLFRCYAALMVRTKSPYYEWASKLPTGGYDVKPRVGCVKIFLIPSYDYFGQNLETIIEERWEFIFEDILFAWNTDESEWPKDRTFGMFEEWFDITPTDSVVDTGGIELY